MLGIRIYDVLRSYSHYRKTSGEGHGIEPSHLNINNLFKTNTIIRRHLLWTIIAVGESDVTLWGEFAPLWCLLRRVAGGDITSFSLWVYVYMFLLWEENEWPLTFSSRTYFLAFASGSPLEKKSLNWKRRFSRLRRAVPKWSTVPFWNVGLQF